MPKVYLQALPVPKVFEGSVDRLYANLYQALREPRRKIMADFRSSVSTWDHPVAFRSYIRRREGRIVLYVYTNDRIYKFLNDGTASYANGQAYEIKANITPKLRIRPDFKSKTTNKRIRARRGHYGKRIVYKYKVLHPGVYPRDFTGMIARKHKADVRKAFRDFLNTIANQ